MFNLSSIIGTWWKTTPATLSSQCAVSGLCRGRVRTRWTDQSGCVVGLGRKPVPWGLQVTWNHMRLVLWQFQLQKCRACLTTIAIIIPKRRALRKDGHHQHTKKRHGPSNKRVFLLWTSTWATVPATSKSSGKSGQVQFMSMERKSRIMQRLVLGIASRIQVTHRDEIDKSAGSRELATASFRENQATNLPSTESMHNFNTPSWLWHPNMLVPTWRVGQCHTHYTWARCSQIFWSHCCHDVNWTCWTCVVWCCMCVACVLH